MSKSTIHSNVMIDLETMDNTPTAAIVAIGAVCMDLTTPKLGPTFYQRIHLGSAVEHGGTIGADTVLWWMQQSEAARDEITRTDAPALDIVEALELFNAWMRDNTEDDVAVWGNGASFDNVILRGACQRANVPTPWEWWNDRCYRSMKALHRDVPFERLGEAHNALSDAISQARHLMRILSSEETAQ